jgi:hypothetical protein
MLMMLKDNVFQKSVFDEYYKPLKDILKTDFYMSLDGYLKKQVDSLNESLFEGYV